MFICQANCIDRYEGSAVDYAKLVGPRSFGPCEVCRRTGSCYDLYSGNPNWRLKKAKKEA